MPQPEILLTVPAVEVHQVHQQQDHLLQQGPLSLLVDHSNAPKPSTIVAEVGPVQWALVKTAPCLKSDERTYIFSLPNAPDVFYCVILAPGTPTFIIEAFEGVLGSSCDFSTMPAGAGSDAGPASVAAGIAPTGNTAQQGGQPAASTASKMTKDVSHGLVRAGEIGAACLVGLAGLAATGIQKITDVTVKNTAPSPTGAMAPETRAKLDKAKGVIAQTSSVLSKFATSASSAAGTATQSLSRSLSKNAQVQKFTAHPDVQVLGTASQTAGSHLLSGLVNAANIVSASTKAAYQQYHAKKYPGEGPTSAPAGPSNPAQGTGPGMPFPPPQGPAPGMPNPYPQGTPAGMPPNATPRSPFTQHQGPSAGMPPNATPPAAFPPQQGPFTAGMPPNATVPPAGYPGAGPSAGTAPGSAPPLLYPEVQQPSLYPPHAA